ncbi:hypothetical protein [Methylophaga sp. OBS3]|uniref:hypothetical protein n=1 Tax=Methylophaga sp. OBS3 TaxID=2991934 RepID=UPI00224DC8C3|nr:hypothetical protein [Methylophaga sp. OBS3]MCX4190567.1 hypothetical protein [Methylophaga sp. OBS3]
MKKLLMTLPLVLMTSTVMAISAEDEKNYTQNYQAQLKPLVVKQLSADRPEMTAAAVEMEANAYVAKMASCQLKGLKLFPENYQEKAILPVAQGADLSATTQALNAEMIKDIEAGTISKDAATLLIQNAQETVQICLNNKG